MSSLILKLRKDEKLFLNGAIVQNAGSKAELKICSDDVKILRMREALHPNDATTPVKRAYYLAQLGVTGYADDEQMQSQLRKMLLDLVHVFEAFPECALLRDAVEKLERRKFYQVMKSLKKFFELEQALMKNNDTNLAALNIEATAASAPMRLAQ